MRRLLFDIYVWLLVWRLHRAKRSIWIECYNSADCYVITRFHEGHKLFLCWVDKQANMNKFCDEVDEAWNKYHKCYYYDLYDATKELYRQRNMTIKGIIESLKTKKKIKLKNEYLRKF